MVNQYKLDIIERLGGKNTVELTLVALAQRIQTDPELREFFENRPLEDLIAEQTQLFTAVFAKHPENYNLKNFVYLRQFGLIQQGFNERHFDLLVHHFEQELEDSWVNTIAIQDAVSLLNEVRSVFESKSYSSTEFKKEDDTVTLSSRESSSRSSQKVKKTKKKQVQKTSDAEVSEKSRRGSSGEFLLNMIRGKGTKRSKQ